ncbi:hypothetical protein [Bacillus toyonensis]|uniref:hypothetical protein n=1 Tax=Bacillus toyonensis TaxID=155322 RepID=UPI002E1C3B62|nr:hypothetical protein [Bacillus toyonensis]
MNNYKFAFLAFISVGFLFSIAAFQDNSWNGNIESSQGNGYTIPSENVSAVDAVNPHQDQTIIQTINNFINKKCDGVCKYDEEQSMWKKCITLTK